MTKKTHRFTAIAMAFMMASSCLAGTVVATPATETYAAEEQSQSLGVAPKQYTKSMIEPMTDENEIETVVTALVSAMTEDEKWGFLALTGTGSEGNAGELPGVARLGVPRIKMYDGPAGLLYLYETTNVPEEELLAATWNPDMAYKYGSVYSTEGTAMGAAVYLSAQLDIQRHPFWNRTKDQMGADSFLLSSLADDLVKGMQSEGSLANLKHYSVCSDEGKLMNNVRQVVGEQTLHETYLPGFESAIKDGGAMSVMSGYNMLNDKYASADDYSLNTVLREQWNFKGFTITDWGGNHSFTIDNGTDIEAPQNTNNNKVNADALVENGTYTREEMDNMIDESVKRVLRAYAVGGYLSLVKLDADGKVMEYEVAADAPTSKRATTNDPSGSELVKVIDTTPDIELLSYEVGNNADKVEEIAEEGMVLLKNENNALPVAASGTTKVNVIGTNGTSLISGIGGERSYGAAYQMTSPADALTEALGSDRVAGYSYEEVIGTVIPTDNLYTTADGNEHGAVRLYGTDAAAGDVVYENGQYHGNGTAATSMPGHEDGTLAAIDATIDFTTDMAPSTYTYKYAEGSDLKAQFGYESGAAYTWNTYVEIPEDGDYKFILQSIGASASMSIYRLNYVDGALVKNASGSALKYNERGGRYTFGSASGGTDNQGTNWFNSNEVTATGQNVSSLSVNNAKAGQRYLVTLSSAVKFAEKDMQVGLAWVTPSDVKAQKDDAITAAAKPDTTSIVFVHQETESVGDTREETSLRLDNAQETMIETVAAAAHAAGNKVVVVVQSSQQVVMPWADDVDAILYMYFAGQRGGAAVANILTGEVNPSGHLAYTIPANDSDTIITYSDEAFASFKKSVELTQEQKDYDNQGGSWSPSGGMGGGFPGFGGGSSNNDETDPDAGSGSGNGGWNFGGGGAANTTNEIVYSEGIFTDYRFFDKYDITPAYDFGYGLSYTSFAYSDIKVEVAPAAGETVGFDVTFTVKNVGEVAGKDVAQVYLGEVAVPEGVQMAEYQLAGFQKTEELAPGESQTITIHVSQRSLSYWDTAREEYYVRADGTKDKWTIADGSRSIVLATSESEADFVKSTKVNVSANGVSSVEGSESAVPTTAPTAAPSSDIVSLPTVVATETPVSTPTPAPAEELEVETPGTPEGSPEEKVDEKVAEVAETFGDDVKVVGTTATIEEAPKAEKKDGVFVTEDGTVASNTFVEGKNGKTYFTDENGKAVKNSVVTDGENLYVTDKRGAVQTNKVVTLDNGSKMLASESGALITKENAKVKSNGNTYVTKDDGVLAQNEFVTLASGKTYYADKNGKVKTGVIKVEGKKYITTKTGIVKKDAVVTVDGVKYKTDKTGVVITNKDVTIKGVKYHADENGKLTKVK